MFKNQVSRWLIAAGIIGILVYSLLPAQDYASKAKEKRAQYLENLMKEKDSPIANVADFPGFSYFDPDESWVISADFKATTSDKIFQIIMTDSTVSTLPKLGEATFRKNGEVIKVHIFDEKTHYLLPFRDETNGETTYGGGRYINIPKENLSGNTLVIDFNEAHNFYCAYNEKYICPVPPAENKLPIAVPVGEKTYSQP
ncbi:MAG: DUF1684 domain-containing protein [Spirosomataceae bacterium]